MKPNQIVTLENTQFRLRLCPAFGSQWMSLEIKKNHKWVHLLRPVATTHALRRAPFEYGMFIMAPWCNRMPESKFSFRGKTYRLKSNLEDGSAIHGDVYRQRWKVERRTREIYEATCRSEMCADFNFPFALEFRMEVRLQPRSVAINLTIKNPTSSAVPVGAGFHPFFFRGTDMFLTAPYRFAYNAGPYPNEKKPLTKRFPGSMKWNLARQNLDHTLASRRHENIALSRTHPPIEIEIAPHKHLDKLFVYSPEEHSGKKADFACIEPMSMLPNGFALHNEGLKDAGLKILKKGENFKVGFELFVR